MIQNSTRIGLRRALGLEAGADDDAIITAVKDLLSQDESDGATQDKTASRAVTDPRLALRELTEETAARLNVSFTEALARIKADPTHRPLLQRVGDLYAGRA